MSMNKFLGAATSVVLIGIAGGSAVAQTAQVQLPAALAELNLSNIRTDAERGGFTEIEGRTADGLYIEALIDADGNLLDADVDNGTMPESLVNALLPEAARSNDVMGQFATIDGIKNNNGSFEVQGEDSSRQELFAVFDQNGKLLRTGHDD